ncbi:hypothetical protein [Vreelandella azerica]|uniref:hypothetical protein n=1 Tax=Vreelandella azerica TaxID=2732867 RepID=UPI001F21E3C4|nr:hypothetical protein [Halomonas azerica]
MRVASIELSYESENSFLPAMAAFFGVVLSGCALAPGGNIEYRTESAPLDDLVDIEPITPGLVSTYRSVVSRAQPLSAEQRQAFDDYEYLVGPGDVLSIIVITIRS